MGRAEKRSFLMYYDYRQHFDLLSDEQLGMLLRAIFDYEENGLVPDYSDYPALQMCFSFVRAALDRDREEYARRCDSSRENGKKGGRPQKQSDETQKTNGFSGFPKKPKKPDNDNDNDNENDIDSDNENETRKPQKPIRHKHGQYQNVLLTDVDLEQLRAEFPSDWQERIERLSEYMVSSGKCYRNHLVTIRAWARRDAEKQPEKSAAAPTYDLSFLLEG